MTNDVHMLSGAYAVDALEDAERGAFEGHLAQCAQCQEEVASLRETAAGLSPLTAVPPPSTLRTSVLDQIRTVRPAPPPAPAPAPATPPDPEDDGTVVPLAPRRRRWWIAVAAAAAAVLGVFGIVRVVGDDPPPRLSAVAQVTQAPDAQQFAAQVDGGTATVVRSPSEGKAVLTTEGVTVPDGSVVQAWYQEPGGDFVSAGVLPAPTEGTTTVVLEGDAATAAAAALSVEPEGGSPQPTTEPIALFDFT